METRLTRHQTAKVPHSRWLAYATATTATTLASSHSLEADIHYSGILNQWFPPRTNTSHKFPLDQHGDSLFFEHATNCNVALFSINGIVSAAFRGSIGYSAYVSKLSRGQNIATCGFITGSPGYIAVSDSCLENSQWKGGTGYIGFRFNNGAGIQYGWARVTIFAKHANAFRVEAYAYADPGEPLRAGQRSTGEAPSEERGVDQGSLGWLALGAVGLLAWRKGRSRRAWSS